MLYKLYLLSFVILLIFGCFFKKKEGGNQILLIDVGVCLSVSILSATFFSLYPLANDYPLTDSSVFIYIGKRMIQGEVPYKDLFDHKGILLYFIQYVGLIISKNNYVGIWGIEVLNLFVTAIILYKISSLLTKDRMIRYLSVMATIVICGLQCYEGGNLTEEYALPWISYALYIFLKYFRNFKYCFGDIVGLGISFAVVSLLRVNMVAVWIAVMPIVFIRMLYMKQYKELGRCTLAFVLGVLSIYIPVFIYTFKADCFGEMINYYIQFNFEYSGAFDLKRVLDTIVVFFKLMVPAIIAGAISLVFEFKNRTFLISLWVMIVTLVLAYMNGIMHPHYGIVVLPVFVVFFSYGISNIYQTIEKLLKDTNSRRYINNFLFAIGVMLFTTIAIILKSEIVKQKFGLQSAISISNELQSYLQENTNENDDVLIIGNDVKYYLVSERKTNNKYFYQTPPINVSYNIYQEFVDELEKNNSDYIIVMGNKEENLSRGDNLSNVCQYLEWCVKEGKYIHQEGDDLYIYIKVLDK